MYSNKAKMTCAPCLWLMPATFALTGIFVFIGVFFDSLGCPPAQSVLFLFMAALCAGVVWLYVRTALSCFFATALNNILSADDDGYVPIEDICKALAMNEVKAVKRIRLAIRRGYLINLNYSAAEKAIYLSDKAKAPIPILQGKPEDKPFVGVHCEGCGATLKIRVNTRGRCPFCGREIMKS